MLIRRTAPESFDSANKAEAGYTQPSPSNCRLKLKLHLSSPGSGGAQGLFVGGSGGGGAAAVVGGRGEGGRRIGGGGGGSGGGGRGAASASSASSSSSLAPPPRQQGWLAPGGRGGGWWDVVVGELLLTGGNTDVHCQLQGSNTWVGGIDFASVMLVPLRPPWAVEQLLWLALNFDPGSALSTLNADVLDKILAMCGESE